MIFDGMSEKPSIAHNWDKTPLDASRARSEMLELLQQFQDLGMMFTYRHDPEGGSLYAQMLPGTPDEPALRLLHSDGNERMVSTWLKMRWHVCREFTEAWEDPWIEIDEDTLS